MTVEQFLAEKTAKTDTGFLCLECGRGFASVQGLKVHARDLHVHRDASYLCPVCRRRFRTRNSFGVHVSVNHKHMKGVDLHRFIMQ